MFFLAALSFQSSAALINRGNGLIYDSATNLTWMQDTHYALTSGFTGVDVRDVWGRVQPSVDAYGRMNWNEAMRLASQTTFGGYDDWRLPRQGAGPCCFADRHSEMAVMFYDSLGNQGAMVDGVLNKGPWGLLNKGPFIFDNTTVFWTGEGDGRGYTWVFETFHGFSGTSDGSDIYAHYGAWLVRDGDVVIPVPEPVSFPLLAIGVAFLLFRARSWNPESKK